MIPEPLVEAIEKELSRFTPSALRRAREDLSHRYRTGLSPRMTTDEERVSYLATRMPATLMVMQKVFAELSVEDKTVLDIGAGPGTAYWALDNPRSITHLEHDAGMVTIGKRLINGGKWITGSFLDLPFTPHDIALFSYSFNEAVNTLVLDKAWAACETIVIIEPGTPRGYSNILLAREHLKKLGAYMVAPCPHYDPCPMKDPDWCHFSARVSRHKWHKELKDGTLGYEDEKYSYLIVSKTPRVPLPSRVVFPPEKHSGHLSLALCTSHGLVQQTFSKKHGAVYKAARKLEWGDGIILD